MSSISKVSIVILALMVILAGVCFAAEGQADKKLTRDVANAKIAGVCSGIADYFGWDVTLVRLGWIVFTLAGGAGLVLYVAAWIIMPTS